MGDWRNWRLFAIKVQKLFCKNCLSRKERNENNSLKFFLVRQLKLMFIGDINKVRQIEQHWRNRDSQVRPKCTGCFKNLDEREENGLQRQY